MTINLAIGSTDVNFPKRWLVLYSLNSSVLNVEFLLNAERLHGLGFIILMLLSVDV